VNLIVQVSRMADGTRKVTAISEITGMEGEVITMQDIFVFEKVGVTEDGKIRGRFRATGIRPKCAERLVASGITLPAEMFEHTKTVG
jgi:pilus assembly protein CpaF